MTPSPIRKVLSILRKNRVRALLMGGQACILYGAAEFSRDVDFAVLADDENLSRLKLALSALRAEPVFFPPLSVGALLRGHACHFRCRAPGVEGLRIDVMSVMNGCDTFEALWSRRRGVALPAVGRVNVLSLPDLVRAKKTQRDKDWPMIRRLVEADLFNRGRRPNKAAVRFWLEELRTPTLLTDLSRRYPSVARSVAEIRPVVQAALAGDAAAIERGLEQEERACRSADRDYWAPLRAELERWRHDRGRR